MNERITITDTDETWQDGKLVEAVTVERDVTAQVVEWSLHAQARAALDSVPATPEQRIAALEARVDALTRLVIGRDLLGG